MMKLADKLFELRKEKAGHKKSWQNKSMSLAKAFPSGSLAKHCQSWKNCRAEQDFPGDDRLSAFRRQRQAGNKTRPLRRRKRSLL